MNADKRMADEGFTLIEMLISITITAIILTVLTASFLVFFQNAAYTTGRDDHSAGASILASWLNRDLASATLDTPPVIKSASSCTTTTTLLSISWKDYQANSNNLPDAIPQAGTAFRADYQYLADNSTSNCMIQRVLTKGGTTQPAQPLVHNLVGANLSATTTPPAGNNCPSADTPLSVTLTQYHTTTVSDAAVPYRYFACINARTNGLPTP